MVNKFFSLRLSTAKFFLVISFAHAFDFLHHTSSQLRIGFAVGVLAVQLQVVLVGGSVAARRKRAHQLLSVLSIHVPYQLLSEIVICAAQFAFVESCLHLVYGFDVIA